MKLSISRAVPSILSADCQIEGNIISEGDVHIFGALRGNVIARKLTLGEGGTIEGKIEAVNVVINGDLSGSLSAKSVVLGRTASVTADIIYVSMEIEPGARYEGRAQQVHSFEINSGNVMELPIPNPLQIRRDLRLNGS